MCGSEEIDHVKASRRKARSLLTKEIEQREEVMGSTAVEQQDFKGGDWTDSEIQRFIKRAATFQKEGFGDAEKLAEQMLYRDRPGSGDNRCVCFECRHLDERKCKAQSVPPLRFILQRCDFFQLRGTQRGATSCAGQGADGGAAALNERMKQQTEKTT